MTLAVEGDVKQQKISLCERYFLSEWCHFVIWTHDVYWSFSRLYGLGLPDAIFNYTKQKFMTQYFIYYRFFKSFLCSNSLIYSWYDVLNRFTIYIKTTCLHSLLIIKWLTKYFHCWMSIKTYVIWSSIIQIFNYSTFNRYTRPTVTLPVFFIFFYCSII